METAERIYVAGHRGLVGSAIWRSLRRHGYSDIVGRSHDELDLENQASVFEFFGAVRPSYVVLAAAKVGGIWANSTFPADFIRSNLTIQVNVIEAAYRFGVRKLLFLGSSCIYPKLAAQPIKEEYLLSGYLEPTNRAYAVAKIAGVELCQAYNRQFGTNFICAMPTNLYGPGDTFDLQSSHVIPALIRRFHEAKESLAPFVELWGTGTALREFLHVDDMADACVFLLNCYNRQEIINVGSGTEISIAELSRCIREVVGYEGEVRFNPAMPDGTPRKLLDSTRLLSMGWRPKVELRDGLAETYRWYCDHLLATRPPANRC